jgi:glycosyltransferase involved in cell wall biosynthesis
MALSVSVIIPSYNAANHLGSCLSHLAASTVQPLECLVVDDGSEDSSPDLARGAGATVLSTGGREGPACARNIGARAARGEILFFLDSDVCVHTDTLERLVRDFENDPSLDALIGSYDTSPGSNDFLSQYKNLMHCYVHQQGKSQACTFWSGCGAIRREVFFRHAGFDESYGRPAIEDIELGYRLLTSGHKVVLDKELLVKHLKRWTFWGLLKTDILDRGIPWTELILRDRNMPNDLNLQVSQRISVALAFMLVAVAAAAAVYWKGYFLIPLIALLFLLMSRYWLEFASGPRAGPVLGIMGIVVGVIAWLAWRHQMRNLTFLLILACLLLLMRHRHVTGDTSKHRATRFVVGLYILGATIYMTMQLPYHYLIFGFFVLGALLVILNNRFYLFLAARRGRLFAVAAVPFHLLYHLYNGFSFIAGITHYYWTKLVGRRAGQER